MALQTITALESIEPVTLEDGETVEIQETETRYIEARWLETSLHARPWSPGKRLATLKKGTRLLVRGTVESRDKRGCHNKPWYAVYPFGFVCSEQARPTDDPPEHGPALQLEKDHRLPYRYIVVREDGTAMYRNKEALDNAEVTRSLEKGMTLAATRQFEYEGLEYFETVDGPLVTREGAAWMGEGSKWSGVYLRNAAPGPAFAWVFKDKTPVHEQPDATSDRVDTLPRRARVRILEVDEDAPDAEATQVNAKVLRGKKKPRERWIKIAEDRWVDASRVNEVHVIEPPEGVLGETRLRARGNDQWIDVDLGEQVLVAYRGADPVYATLISSGRGSPTPRGNYPIWAKVTTLTMDNQGYEDNAYMVQHVPWVLLFQGHNALHGAYWHDQFGKRKSHGCVNLAPKDARWVFEWVAPTMHSGWTGYLPGELERSVVVHVRDSSRPAGERFVQDRRPGPPDREEEKRKLEEAEKRRAAAAEAEAAKAAEAANAANAANADADPSLAATSPGPTTRVQPPPRVPPIPRPTTKPVANGS